MKLLINLALLLFFTACASKKLEIINHKQKDNINYTYYIEYPDYKGITKTLAKKKRKDYLDTAIQHMLVSIYRTGNFGRLDYESATMLQYPELPFTLINETSPIFKYQYTYEYGSLKGNFKSSMKQVALNPIAYGKNDSLFTIDKSQMSLIEKNFILLKRSQLTEALSLFNDNYDIVGGKSLIRNFLNKIEYPEMVSRGSESNPSLYLIFKSYKNISPSGMGVAIEEVDEKDSLKFTLNKYNYYPYNKSSGELILYDPVKFIWGLIFVLNSKINIERVNQKTVKVKIDIPVKNILKKYNIKKVSDFIEQ